MTALAVDPKAYYQAAINCFDAASALRDSFLYIFAELSECGSMAGVDENGQEWARSYNTSAYGAVGFFQDVHSTLYAYGSALNDIGFTHAQADATVKGAPQPDRPTDPGMPVFGPFSVPASAGGPGQGIVDKGINIISHIGIPVPDGDTGNSRRPPTRGIVSARSTRTRTPATRSRSQRVCSTASPPMTRATSGTTSNPLPARSTNC
ncbi:hypothetical protein ACRS5S_28985 [Nocardia asiatica]|uniref:hypothetical protein n=1 Tax=Nocardia asiatica TaxID=209252 RepID=UPI002458FFC6|nr:hypothetical protein [Nocardia asiatica]